MDDSSSNSLHIRFADESDLATVNKMFVNYLGNYDYYSIDILRTRCITVVAEHRGEIIGCAYLSIIGNSYDYFFISNKEIYELHGICVNPEHRGKQIAEKLIELLLRDKGITVIVHAWTTGKKARLDRALIKNGFKLIAECKDYWRQTDECKDCAELAICKGVCDNHIYIKPEG